MERAIDGDATDVEFIAWILFEEYLKKWNYVNRVILGDEKDSKLRRRSDGHFVT